MNIDELGLSGAAEYNALAEELARRLGQSRSKRIVEEYSEHYPELLGWWNEADAPPTTDFLSWPPNGYRWPQEHN